MELNFANLKKPGLLSGSAPPHFTYRERFVHLWFEDLRWLDYGDAGEGTTLQKT